MSASNLGDLRPSRLQARRQRRSAPATVPYTTRSPPIRRLTRVTSGEAAESESPWGHQEKGQQAWNVKTKSRNQRILIQRCLL